MKRRDLERHLREHGAQLLREGGNHSYWGFDAERSTAVPRHREIGYGLARKICKDLSIRRRPARADHAGVSWAAKPPLARWAGRGRWGMRSGLGRRPQFDGGGTPGLSPGAPRRRETE